MPSTVQIRIAAIAFVALLVYLVFSGSYFTVAQNERVVVTNFGRFSHVAGPGLNFKIPFVQATEAYRIDLSQVAIKNLSTYTIDSQEIHADIVTQYRLPEENIQKVFSEVRDYRERLQSMVVDRFKSELGKINVNDFSGRRGVIVQTVLRALKDEAARLYGLEIIDFQIPEVTYTQSFREAVNQAAVAKAMVERFEYERKQAEVQADRARIEALGLANAATETARGEAQAIRLRAEAEAAARRLQGEADAAALRMQQEALGINPAIVELEKARRWDGKLPQQMLGAAPIPFLQMTAPAER